MKPFAVRPPSPAMLVSLVALFVALGGTGYAAFSLPRSSVGSKQLKNGAVTTRKIRNGAVTASKLSHGLTVPNAQHALTAGTATFANNAVPSGAAGGGLTGSYPNPTIAPGAVTPASIATVPAAIVTNSADISIPAASGMQNLLSFDTEQLNIDGVHSAANPSRLTAPIAGLYEVHGEVNWFPCSNNGNFDEVEIFLNGSTRLGVIEIPNGTAACVAEGVEALVRMNPGDYVQLYARKSSSVTEGIRGTNSEGSPDSPEWTCAGWLRPDA